MQIYIKLEFCFMVLSTKDITKVSEMHRLYADVYHSPKIYHIHLIRNVVFRSQDKSI
jgi:hypothetical protein